MRPIKFISLILWGICFSLWGICFSGVAQTIHLSPSGNDRNTGASDRPLATLEGARNKIRAMRAQEALTDTVFVRVQGGTYYMQQPFVLSKEDSGTEQSPVLFTGDPADRPLFCGGMKIEPFEEVYPGLWRTFIPEVKRYGFYFELLYINGERRFRAQTPNRGDFYKVQSVEETVLDSTGARAPAFASQKIVVDDKEKGWLNDLTETGLDDALIVLYHKWDNTRNRIRYVNISERAVYFAGEGQKPWNMVDSQTRYVVENYAKALDAPGEWFLHRDGYLYYIPIPGETPENTKCVAPVIENFIIIEGDENSPVEHIGFKNLRFETTAYRTPPNGNGPSQAAADIEATIMIDHADHIHFTGCDIAHTGLHGIWFRNHCSYGRVEQCHLYDLGGGGVKIGPTSMPGDNAVTHHIRVHNNIIHHGGYVFPCAVGLIIFHASDNEVTHNEIADFRYSGVSVGWVWGYAHSPSKRNKIDYNHIHHLGWAELSDMGGVYTLGASEGTTVNNNVIHHIYSYDYGGWGLYTDEGSYDVHMENNLVYACKNAGFHQHYGKENVIRNNIFANNLLSQMQLTRVEEHLSLSFTNNIIYFDEGQLYMSMGYERWLKANLDIDFNCYWNTRDRELTFDGKSLKEWRKLGRDKHSVIEDPLFANPEQFDFRFKNESVARKIKFKPFDYTQAGVYGNKEWTDKAKMPRDLLDEFDSHVKRLMRKD